MFPHDPLMSDEKLIKEFNAHRSAFEKLVTMASEDEPLGSVYRDLVLLNNTGYLERWHDDSNPGFSQKRWNEYRAIFNEAEILWVSKTYGVIIFGPLSVDVAEIDNSYESIVVSKGIAYSETSLPTVDSLDSMGFETSPILYKSIGGNWYLYRDWGISKPE